MPEDAASTLERHTPWRRWLPAYVLLFTAIGLLNSLSELQSYHRGGGMLSWEPFLWEFSSVLCVALLLLALYRLVRRIEALTWPRQLLWHVGGYFVFTVLHVAGMYGIRFAVYALAEVRYEPGSWLAVLAFEAGQDAVSYLTLLLLSHGYRNWRHGQTQAALLERTRRELAEAQAARLADQVQPHFLFNTLNLIASTMHEDVARADRLLCDLATLLRQTSQAQQRSEHSLDEELALVQPFLALMQARFGAERLQVHIEASAAARGARLPALLLLAPVENAIKHDVAQHRGQVLVRLHAELRDARLCIELDNSGVSAPGQPDGGSGLRNLQERLQARYGSRALLGFGPFEGGMRLRLELPQ